MQQWRLCIIACARCVSVPEATPEISSPANDHRSVKDVSSSCTSARAEAILNVTKHNLASQFRSALSVSRTCAHVYSAANLFWQACCLCAGQLDADTHVRVSHMKGQRWIAWFESLTFPTSPLLSCLFTVRQVARVAILSRPYGGAYAHRLNRLQ